MARRGRIEFLAGAAGAGTALCISSDAAAHAFGARYDLPLPLWFYLVAAGAVVAGSFAVLVLFLRWAPQADRPLRLTILRLPLPVVQRLLIACRCLAVALFVLIVAAGLFGTQSPTKNLAPTMVWVIWWVGFAFACALLGNIWRVFNPWDAIYRSYEALRRWFWTTGADNAAKAYPPWLGVWPCVVLYLGFSWSEIASDVGEAPRTLAFMIVAYSALTWAGMALFGRQTWLERGEVFHQVFGLLARFAPIEAERSHAGDAVLWRLRPYAVGLLSREPINPSLAALVLAVLAVVTFDGFIETPAWSAILDWLTTSDGPRAVLQTLRNAGFDLAVVVTSTGLVTAFAAFTAAYLLFAWLVRQGGRLGGGAPHAFAHIAGVFVLSLVPIAIAYHIAHYFSFLLLAGQLIIPLVSDPFGFGWNLFRTVHIRMDLSIVNARMVWIVAVTAIVIGHILAVFTAHIAALRLYPAARAMLASQAPLLVLMVLYTMSSLWILSQPIVNP